MANTPTINLRKPARADFVSVVNDINDNMDKIDNYANTTNQAIAALNSNLGYVRNVSSTNDILASALACTGTTVYRGAGSSYTGVLPDNNFKWGAFVVIVADALRYVWAQSSANNYATNFYNGSSWSGWQQLALNSERMDYFMGVATSSPITSQVLSYAKTNLRGRNGVSIRFYCTGSSAPSDLPDTSNVWKYCHGEFKTRSIPINDTVDGMLILYGFNSNKIAFKACGNDTFQSNWKIIE